MAYPETIEHPGVVHKKEGKLLQVRILSAAACGSCQVKGICPGAESSNKIIDVPSHDAHYQPGEKVIVQMHKKTGYKAVWLAYILPFLLVFAVLIGMMAYTGNEALSGAISLLVLIPYYLILGRFKNQLQHKIGFSIKKEE
jgi:sigma-E factor negative regulatory protein RseC